MGDKDNYKLIANNKKAYFDYFIEDTWEAGIALLSLIHISEPTRPY